MLARESAFAQRHLVRNPSLAGHPNRLVVRFALLVGEVEHPGREDSPSCHRRVGG